MLQMVLVDVYKRQVWSQDDVSSLRHKQVNSMLFLACPTHEPVSYTHLEVMQRSLVGSFLPKDALPEAKEDASEDGYKRQRHGA